MGRYPQDPGTMGGQLNVKPSVGRIAAFVLLAIVGCLSAPSAAPVAAEPLAAAETSDAALGERLFKTGIGASGEPVAAIDLSGRRVFAPQFHCAACHRNSGFGSREGGIYIPPIVGKVLYAPMVPDRARSFNTMYYQDKNAQTETRIKSARTRPAYDFAALGRLLRTGIDSAGEPVSHAMPRFEVSDRDVAALDAWLHVLSGEPDPGVDDQAIQFAVIVSDRTPAPTRQALIDTSRVFFERVNKNIENDRSRPGFSPMFRSEFASFWRNWNLNVWTLKGEPATWPEQLDAYYKATPVFAVTGGAVAAPWQPVGEFCDREKLPCLFPLTDMPAKGASEGGYTLYSYGGLSLEAEAMAEFVRRDEKVRRIVQLAADGPQGLVPAAALAEHWGAIAPGLKIETVRVAPGEWRAALDRTATTQAGDGTALAIWPGTEPAAVVAALAQAAPSQRLVMLPASTEPFAIASLTASPLAERLRIMRPTELPSVINPHSYRVRAWLNARRVVVDPPEEQFQIYYGLSVLEKAVMEIQGDFSREYLIEEIEMIAESNLNPGVYPDLTLGPGQRIASRGSYVVRLDSGAEGGVSADGDWIVP